MYILIYYDVWHLSVQGGNSVLFVYPVPCFCLATVGTSLQLSGLLPHWVSVTYLGVALGFAVKGYRVHRNEPWSG